MLQETSVFNRTTADSHGQEIGAGMYNLTIGTVLCWGFFVNWMMVRMIDPAAIAQINPLVFFIGYFVCAMAGAFIFKASSNPLISFLGYNLVVLPFGLVVNLSVHAYDPSIVNQAIQTTGLVTAVMMVLGTLFPKFFFRISGALTIALLVVVVVEMVQIFIFKTHTSILDWIVVLIFCGYIGVDWARANSIPRTLDNAIDSAASLYMDIIILFLRLLSIFGRRD